MATLPRTFVDNPVARAELNHQDRSAERRKWQRWPTIFGLGLGIALLSDVCLLLAPLIGRVVGMPGSDVEALLYGWFGTITVLMGTLMMIHHLSFSTAALQLASASIAREKQHLTWESLLLTGLDARQIIFGKWWATMRTLWRIYRPLLVLRFAVALWMSLSGTTAHITPFFHTPPLLEGLLIGGVTAVFPFVYAAFAVSLGLLASLLVGGETAAYRVASLFQFASIVISLCLIALSFALPFSDVDPGLTSLIPALFVTPLDGGLLALIGMIGVNDGGTLYYVVGVVLCMALYAGLTWALLRGAQALAVRQRALPPKR